jgi:hypothetical protein
MINSIDAGKAFNKIQHLFMIKTLMKLRIEGMCLNIINPTYDKHMADIILNGEKLKPFALKSETRQGCPLAPLSLNIVLEFLARAIRQEEETNRIQIRKEEVKLSLFADDMILYLKDLKNSNKKFLDIINIFSKIIGHKINLRKSVAFIYTNNEQTERRYMKTITFKIPQKIISPGANLIKDMKDL